MKVTRTSDDAVTVELESEQELRDEHRTNLSAGGLLLATAEKFVLYSKIVVTLRTAWGAELVVAATVVALMPAGVALAIERSGDEILAALLPKPAPIIESEPVADEPESPESAASEKGQSLSERLRSLPRVQKILLGSKADRTERAVMLQDNDPQVLSSLLRNPRITIEEVIRIAKSNFLSYQIVELIMGTGAWMGSVELRVALVHNPRTPPQFALRILPTLPEQEVRTIARGAATSMALKQAALKRLQGGK